MSEKSARDVVSQCFENEAVIVDLETNRIFHLNETAARVWQLLESGRTPGEIKATLLSEYQVRPAELEADLSSLLTALQRERLIAALR